jgi:hypothetical protein
MSEKIQGACRKCIFWEEHKVPQTDAMAAMMEQPQVEGFCLRNPPIADHSWPLTYLNDICGCYYEKDDEGEIDG